MSDGDDGNAEGWNEYAEELSESSTSSAILTIDGTICGKAGEFNATTSDCKGWAAVFKNLQYARQKPLSVAGKKLFVYEVDEDPKNKHPTVIARRDNYFLFLQKLKTIIVCAIVEDMYGASQMSPEEVKDDVQRVVDMLAEADC